MKFLPKSILGILGFGIAALFDLLLVLKFLMPLPVSTPTIFGGVLLALTLSVVAWLRKDRAWSLVIFALPTGLFVLVWTIAEVIWPH
ncbi:MAG: hypothetical protein RL142_329 [Actinomycetota bacterium]|jgi:hypothetical protein